MKQAESHTTVPLRGRNEVIQLDQSDGISFLDVAASLGIELDLPAGCEKLVPALEEITLMYASGDGGMLCISASIGYVDSVLFHMGSGGASAWAAQTVARIDASLSDVPLVGGGVPESDDIVLTHAGIVWTSANMSSELLKKANGIIAGLPGGSNLPLFPEHCSSQILLVLGWNVGNREPNYIQLPV